MASLRNIEISLMVPLKVPIHKYSQGPKATAQFWDLGVA